MIDLPDKREVALPAARRAFAVRQGARLTIGGAGLAGGAFLLATNVLATLTTTTAGSIPWLPLSANVALIVGSAMFLREYRRAARERRAKALDNPNDDRPGSIADPSRIR